MKIFDQTLLFGGSGNKWTSGCTFGVESLLKREVNDLRIHLRLFPRNFILCFSEGEDYP